MFAPSQFFDLADCITGEIFIDCTTVWEAIPKIAAYLSKQNLGAIKVDIEDGVVLVNKELITIEEGCHIEAGSWIQGPCYLGGGTIVRQGAYIRGNVITGRNCVIGHASEVKNALFLNEAKAAHFAYVGDSILGNHVNLGAGTKLANLKLDSRPVALHHEGRRIETGLRKFGAILGDSVQTGCNSVTNPGALMGKGASCYPCSVVTGFVPAGKCIK